MLRRCARVDEEATKLRDEGTAAVLCDVSPSRSWPLDARGSPDSCWPTSPGPISMPLCQGPGENAAAFVSEMRRDYRQATALFRAEPALQISDLAPTIEVGMVGTPGRNRRGAARGSSALSHIDQARLFLRRPVRPRRISAGSGSNGLQSRGIHFVGFHEAPVGPLAQPARDRADRMDRSRPGRLGRCDRGQGRRMAPPAKPWFPERR